MHHRTPTSSRNRISQTHPISIKNKNLKHNYLIFHNGIINNENEMKVDHEKIGFFYTTEKKLNQTQYEFNDSESLAIDLARFIEKQIPQIKTKGSAAYIILQINKKTNKAVKLFFGTNNNPLKLSQTRGKLRLSSEGEGNEIKENIMYNCNLKDFSIKKQKCEIKLYTQEKIQNNTNYNLSYNSPYSSSNENYFSYNITEDKNKEKLIEPDRFSIYFLLFFNSLIFKEIILFNKNNWYANSSSVSRIIEYAFSSKSSFNFPRAIAGPKYFLLK